MGDLAPAAAQRTSDDRGRIPEGNRPPHKKAAKKAMPAPARKQDQEPALPPEPQRDHQLDVMA